MTDEMGSKQAKSKVATDTKILYLRTDPPVLDSLPEVGERPVRVVDHLVPVAGVQPLEWVPHHHELEEGPLGVLQFGQTLQLTNARIKEFSHPYLFFRRRRRF